jgi:4-hydroxyacetophenone monooxygenase
MATVHDLLSDDLALQDALRCANLPTLLMVLVHLTGDASWLRGDIKPQRASPQRPDAGIDDAQGERIRTAVRGALQALHARGGALPPLPEPALLEEMMSFYLGQPVPREYLSVLYEQTGLVPAARAPDLAELAQKRDFHAAIVGAGMSGIVAAIKLREAGIPFTIFEKNRELGGTWFENDYPGCRVDLPSHFYALSFEPNHDWPEHFSRAPDVLSYFRRVADKYDLRRSICLDTEVLGATFDGTDARWRLSVRSPEGERCVDAHVLISAVGQLNRPNIPNLPGVESFRGAAFHTARFRHDVELRDQRIGVLGTGASAMQVVPQLASQAQRLHVFQRSPQWATRNPDYFRSVPEGKKWLLRHLPYYADWYRFRMFYMNADGVHAALQVDPSWPHAPRSINAANDRIRRVLTEYIERELADRPDLLPQVLPEYAPFAKRMLIDNDWFRTLKRDNVELVTQRIASVSEHGVRLEDGSERTLDVLVYATGFQAGRMLAPMVIRGPEGRTLSEHWAGDPRAHLGITVPGFPNLFLLYGPNTHLAHGGSIIFHSECQVRYVMGCLSLLLEGGHRTLTCKQEAHDAYNRTIDAAHDRMIWSLRSVSNYFRNEAGRVVTNSPFRLVDYAALTRSPKLEDLELR